MRERNIDTFDQDIEAHGSYVYTQDRLSCNLANARSNLALRQVYDFNGKSVIDIGCGDGSYAVELFKSVQLKSLVGVDLAPAAVERARKVAAEVSDKMTFQVEGAYELPFADDTFDVAHMRAVLHHFSEPDKAIKEALRVAKAVVVVDPNGYSPILKFLEKASRYHREHDEMSWTAGQIDRWIHSAGGKIQKRQWSGLVPMFCPDWFAKSLKKIEPVFEATPLISRFACAVYVVSAEK